MRKASALLRFIVSGMAACVLLTGCGPAAGVPSGAGADPRGQARAEGQHPAPGQGPAALPAGPVQGTPTPGGAVAVAPDLRPTALLIGDSQSQPDDSWPRRALVAAGYGVHFCGLGGTGFVAANGKTGNYIDALERGDWKLPGDTPALIVIQGGGNDAAQGASDARIAANAGRLIAVLRDRYPGTKMAMVGTLARGAGHGGGRRTQVDAVLGTVALRQGIAFVGVGDWLTRYDLAKHLSDSVHMDTAGRRRLGTLLESSLRRLGLEAPPLDARVPVAAASGPVPAG